MNKLNKAFVLAKDQGLTIKLSFWMPMALVDASTPSLVVLVLVVDNLDSNGNYYPVYN